MTMIDNNGNDDSGPTEGQTATIPDPPPPDPAAAASIREARSMIPVGPTGAAPMNFAQQVDFAKTMALAKTALPSHLRNNAGDCLALIDIATRANLSPYMLASKTYVQNDRLCFESQAYHALAQSSGLMSGDLHPTYDGTGEERTCTVTGYLRGDPRPKVHTSPPLKDVRPAKNDRGQVKGSPLWTKKPDVQLFYDTSRDWVRIYAPRATLGIYTPDEIEEYADHFGDAARDVTPAAGLKDRLNGADRTEGHKPDHAHTELANIAPGNKVEILPPEKEKDTKTTKAKDKAKPTKEPEQPGEHGHAEPSPATTKPRRSLRRRRTAAPEQPTQEPADPKNDIGPEPMPDLPSAEEQKGPPTTAADYQPYAIRWIDAATDQDDALGRWDGEDEMRNTLSVGVRIRIALKARLNAKFGIEE